MSSISSEISVKPVVAIATITLLLTLLAPFAVAAIIVIIIKKKAIHILFRSNAKKILFNRKKGLFEYQYTVDKGSESETEIYLPKVQFPSGFTINKSKDQYVFLEDEQLLKIRNEKEQDMIIKSADLIENKIEIMLRQRFLNQAGYDIIKNNINYLKINL